jgi:hypothetical protein
MARPGLHDASGAALALVAATVMTPANARQSSAATDPHRCRDADRGGTRNVGAIQDGFITILSDLHRAMYAGNARAIYPIGEHERTWLVTGKLPLPAGDDVRSSDVTRLDAATRRGGMDEYVRLRRMGIGN